MSRETHYVQEYTTLGIASSGAYATVGANCSVTIYDSRLSPYFGCLVEGGIVCDQRPCVGRSDFVMTVVSGPMLRESLPARTRQRMFEGPSICYDVSECTGTDYVSADLYYDLWESKGARIGRRQGGLIVWNDGTASEIPSFANRYMFDF